MRGILLRWLILTTAVLAASYFIDGIQVSSFKAALLAAALLAILNALFRPVLLLLTLPINILTLGLFTFVINGLLLLMASGVIKGFYVQGFWTAVLGSLIISLTSWALNSLINDQGRVEVLVIERAKRDQP